MIRVKQGKQILLLQYLDTFLKEIRPEHNLTYYICYLSPPNEKELMGKLNAIDQLICGCSSYRP